MGASAAMGGTGWEIAATFWVAELLGAGWNARNGISAFPTDSEQSVLNGRAISAVHSVYVFSIHFLL